MSKLSRKCRVLPLVLLGGVAACGSDSEERPAQIQDPMQFDATPETRAELGIERWGLINVTPTETFLHGYDAQHRMTLEWHRKLGFDGPGAESLVTELAGEHGTASMRISMITRAADNDLETSSVVEENTFQTNDQAQRTVERLRADVAVAAPVVSDGSATRQTSLVKQSIGLMDLTRDEGRDLLSWCKMENQGTCTKEAGVALLKKWCTALLSDCKSEVVKGETSVLVTSSSCAHQEKNTSWLSRRYCGNVSSSDSCTRDNTAVSDCAKAVETAKADAANSAVCQANHRVNANCADPGPAWDKVEEDLKKRQDCGRKENEADQRRQQCVNTCLDYMKGLPTPGFALGGAPADFAKLSDPDKRRTCNEICPLDERDPDCVANR